MERADLGAGMMEWFYALMVVVIVGGIAFEAYLEKRSRRRKYHG